jgi:hypothetical protein
VEFVGRARELRRRLGDSACYRDAVDALVAPIVARWRKYPTRSPHPDILTAAARDWRERVPAAGRLELAIALRRKSLQVRELRAVTGSLKLEAWGPDSSEPGIAVCAIDFLAKAEHVHLDTTILAIASLHAVARRLQRGRDMADAAVMRDMHALAAAAPGGEAHDEVVVPASGGRWVGTRAPVLRHGETILVLAIRTFLD